VHIFNVLISQLARAHGCTVLGTAGTEKGLKFVSEQGNNHSFTLFLSLSLNDTFISYIDCRIGAHYTFNHKTKDYTDQILKVTNSQGVDVIVEMLADVNLDKDLKMLAIDGRVVVVGCRGKIEIEPRYVLKMNSYFSFIHSFHRLNLSSHFVFSVHTHTLSLSFSFFRIHFV
jgi:NADPH2:quinone reductase